MTHPYKRSAFLAGAATLALAVTACGNDGDMSDVLQGKETGTASAVSGGTTEATTQTETDRVRDMGSWLAEGETYKLTPVPVQGTDGKYTITDLTVDNVRVLSQDDPGFTLHPTYEGTEVDDAVCYDMTATYSGDPQEPTDGDFTRYLSELSAIRVTASMLYDTQTGITGDQPSLPSSNRTSTGSGLKSYEAEDQFRAEHPGMQRHTAAGADVVAAFDFDAHTITLVSCGRPKAGYLAVVLGPGLVDSGTEQFATTDDLGWLITDAPKTS